VPPTFTPILTDAPPPIGAPLPTNTPAPTDTPVPTSTPTPPPIGLSRGNPFSRSQVISSANWDFQVLEVVRGDAAWQALQAANQFNDPPPAGMEYLTVKMRVKSKHTDSEEHPIGEGDFRVTGDRLTEYFTASAVSPEPPLDARLFAGGETEGWATYLIQQGESSLVLYIDELLSFDESQCRYVALDEGASIGVSPDLADIRPNDLGKDPASPVPLNQTAITEDWEVTLLEVVRGDPAWAMIQEANQFNEPPVEGMEYVVAKVRVRYINTEDKAEQIDDSCFRSTGSAKVLHDHPSIVAPNPSLDAILFPGGQYEGWAVMQAAKGETDLVAVFETLFDFTAGSRRFFSLQ
jgi:hypothetical protein